MSVVGFFVVMAERIARRAAPLAPDALREALAVRVYATHGANVGGALEAQALRRILDLERQVADLEVELRDRQESEARQVGMLLPYNVFDRTKQLGRDKQSDVAAFLQNLEVLALAEPDASVPEVALVGWEHCAGQAERTLMSGRRDPAVRKIALDVAVGRCDITQQNGLKRLVVEVEEVDVQHRLSLHVVSA